MDIAIIANTKIPKMTATIFQSRPRGGVGMEEVTGELGSGGGGAGGSGGGGFGAGKSLSGSGLGIGIGVGGSGCGLGFGFSRFFS